MSINEQISSAIRDQLEAKGYDLVGVSSVFGSKAAVDIFIDRFDGKPVSIDDCVTVNQIASAVLDVEDIIRGKYNLNVSSPGEYRPLRNERDYERFCGEEVVIELEKPNTEGKRKLRGKLMKAEGAVIDIQEENKDDMTRINIEDIKKAAVHRVFKI